MAITIDVRPSGIESGYEEKPFDEAKTLLEGRGYDIISLKQFADLRIAQGKDSHVANYGAYVREGFLYVPEKGIFLVRNSPIMANAKEATQAHREGKEFYLTPEQVEASLGKAGIDSVKFENGKAVPFKRFGEDKRTVFAFGSSAQPYGDFLQEAFKGTGVSEMPVYLASVEKKPFARQAWLRRLGDDCGSGLNGDRGLGYDSAVRGVRNVEPRSGETVSTQTAPTLKGVLAYSNQFVPEVARKEFQRGLETLFGKQ